MLQVIWTVVVDAVGTQSKNAIQITAAMGKQVKAYKPLFEEFCKSARVEAALIVHVQVPADCAAHKGHGKGCMLVSVEACPAGNILRAMGHCLSHAYTSFLQLPGV